MADALPTEPDVDETASEARVVGVDTEDAESVLSALSSETARELLSELYDEPATASDLADRADTTIQNVQYHLTNLADAGLIDVGDTTYSAKGREMDVYVPADRALVVVPAADDSDSVRDILPELVGALVPLGLLAVLAEILLDGPFAPSFGIGTPDSVETRETGGTDVAAQDAITEQAADPGLFVQATNSPGVAVFVGGLLALAAVALVVWYRRR